MLTADLFFILKWWVLFLFIGITFLPLTFKIFGSFIDKGYLFSKVIGMLILSYSIFILATLKILPFNLLGLFIVWTILTAFNLVLLLKQKIKIRESLKLILAEELIFLAALLFWSWIRSFQPDIHDLEKFMDFGFINSILRAEYFPPKDMWLTPFSINYYYFGHLYTALVTKLSGIPSHISFNLMVATMFAFTFSLAFSIGINLIQKIRNFSLKKSFLIGLLFGFFVALAGNLQTIYSFFKSYNGEAPVPFWDLVLSISSFPNSYWYPNATRFIYHTIHEFPSYSFVVADLHGHVLDLPIVLTLIALAFLIFHLKKISYSLVIFGSFLISIAYMTNAWDGLIYLGLFTILYFVIELLNGENKTKNKIVSAGINTLKWTLVTFLSFFIFTFVFNRNFSPFASGIGVNCSPDFLVKLEKLGPFLFENGQCQRSPIWQLLILYGLFLYMIGSFLIFIRKRKLILADYFVLLISIFSIMLIIAPEFIYLKDIYTGHFRANTMFKLAYQAFIMFSFSSIYILIRIISSFRSELKSVLSKVFFGIFILWSFILLSLSAIYPYFAIPSGYGELKKYKSLDGIRYLNDIKPGDYKAINWINQNIKGQPVILEAQGDSYTDFARISANTGLPTVLGWTVHEWLWRGSYDVPAARFSDIQNLYETTNIGEAKRIIDKYDIEYVYIGQMEREKYKFSEKKFETLGDLVYSNESVHIYKIN
jgi:uncharacterized membrane protein